MKKLNYSNLVTPILVLLLVIAAFLVGMLWTRVQILENGTAPVSRSTPKPAPVVLSADKFNEVLKDAILVSGKPDAKVKMVEFTDFECPVCGRFYGEFLGTIEKEYIDTGKAAYYIRHFPLSIHPNAVGAALAAECAREQSKFREMHDIIFENQSALKISDLKGYAAKLGLNTQQFNSCLDSEKYIASVERDAKLGAELGVSGTPNFFINRRFVNGIQSLQAFKTTIEEELK